MYDSVRKSAVLSQCTKKPIASPQSPWINAPPLNKRAKPRVLPYVPKIGPNKNDVMAVVPMTSPYCTYA